MISQPRRSSQLMVQQLVPRREGFEQQTAPADAAAPSAQDQTCLQQKCQGSAAHCSPHDHSEVGILSVHQLHPELEGCLSSSLMPRKFSLWFWKPELINREQRHKKLFLASAVFLNYAPLFTIRYFKGLQLSVNKKVTYKDTTELRDDRRLL